MEKKYFKVVAKCGHVGRDKYFRGEFFVSAEDGRGAAAKARMMPRVKHDHDDAILGVTKISYEDFCQGREEQKSCPYYVCKSRWQQELIMDQIADNIFSDPRPHDNMKVRAKERSPKRAYKRQSNVTVGRYEMYYDEIKEATSI